MGKRALVKSRLPFLRFSFAADSLEKRAFLGLIASAHFTLVICRVPENVTLNPFTMSAVNWFIFLDSTGPSFTINGQI